MGAMMQGWMGEQPGQPGGAAPGAAGDHQDAHAQAQASASNAHASAHSAAQAAAQDAHSAAHAAAQAAQAAEEAFAAAGMPEGSGEEYLQRVGDFVAAALDPLGIDVQVDVETPGGQRTTVKPSAKTDKTEEDKQDKAASPEAVKEGTPSSSDDEEWTVLSDKKPEAEAVQIPIQVLDKEVAPVYPTLPAEESTTINPKEHDHLCERDPGPGSRSQRWSCSLGLMVVLSSAGRVGYTGATSLSSTWIGN